MTILIYTIFYMVYSIYFHLLLFSKDKEKGNRRKEDRNRK